MTKTTEYTPEVTASKGLQDRLGLTRAEFIQARVQLMIPMMPEILQCKTQRELGEEIQFADDLVTLILEIVASGMEEGAR